MQNFFVVFNIDMTIIQKIPITWTLFILMTISIDIFKILEHHSRSNTGKILEFKTGVVFFKMYFSILHQNLLHYNFQNFLFNQYTYLNNFVFICKKKINMFWYFINLNGFITISLNVMEKCVMNSHITAIYSTELSEIIDKMF